MATPYSTPGFPKAPRPTPSSGSISNRGALRAPIHNPYDKFTQDEFDAWIGDITGALKQALGHEELPSITSSNTVRPQSEEVHSGDVSAYGDVDDSFAEIKARRALKGKERATEEDFPGSDEAGSPEVVVISSDEDDDDEEGPFGAGSGAEEYDEQAEDSDEYTSDAEDDNLDLEVEYELSPDEDPSRRPETLPEDAEQGEEEDDEEEDEDREDENGLGPEPPEAGADEEGGDILYDEDAYGEEEGEASEEDEDELASSPSKAPEVIELEDSDEDQQDDGDADAEVDESADERDVELPDKWEGPSTYAEDFYSGGDIPPGASIESSAHLLPTEMDASRLPGMLESEDGAEDEVFPPQDANDRPIDIVDPWDAPQTFAEDLYTGGDILGDPSLLTPSHLTPALSTPQAEASFDITPAALTPIEAEAADPELFVPSDEGVSGDAPEPMLSPPGTIDDTPEQALDPALLEDVYAELDKVFVMPNGALASGMEQTSVPEVAPEVDPSEEPSDSHVLHDRSSSPPRMSVTGHVDWSFPPAFQSQSAPSSSLALPEASISAPIPEATDQPSNVAEVVIISDDEEDTKPAVEDTGPRSPSEDTQKPSFGPDEADGEGDAMLVLKDNLQINSSTGQDGTEVANGDVAEVQQEDASPAAFSDVRLASFIALLDSPTDKPSEVGSQFTTTTAVEDVLAGDLDPRIESRESAALPEDVGFGDLPATPMNVEETDDNDADVFGILADLSNDAQQAFAGDTTSIFGNGLSAEDYLNYPDTEEAEPIESQRRSADLSEDPSEAHGTFSMPNSTEGEESFMVTDILGGQHQLQASDDVDANADHAVPTVESVEDTVEEPVLQEVPTEKMEASLPAVQITAEGEAQTQDIQLVNREKTPDVQSALRDITSGTPNLSFIAAEADSEDESPRRRRTRYFLQHSRSATSSERGQLTPSSRPAKSLPLAHGTQSQVNLYKQPSLIAPADDAPRTVPLEVVAEDDEVVSEVPQPAEQPDPSDENLIQDIQDIDKPSGSAFPSPVSADPAVPDPASVWGSPKATTPQPEEATKNRREEVERAAETGSLLKASLKQPVLHSASGLFTPATETDSSPTSPAVPSDGIDESSPDAKVHTASVEDNTDDFPSGLKELIPTEESAGSREISEPSIDDEKVVLDDLDVHDDDADGDLDPEYHGDLAEDFEVQSQIAVPADEVEKEAEDPFKLMGSDSQVAPGEATEEAVADLQSLSTSASSSVSSVPAEARTEPAIAPTDGDEEAHSDLEQPSDNTGEPTRPPKRKRMSSPLTPLRPTSPIPIQESEPQEAARVHEAAAKDEDDEDDDDVDSIASSRDGEVVRRAPRSTRPAELPKTRGSSVGDARSGTAEAQLPSLSIPALSVPAPPAPPPLPVLPLPFVHAGGVLHHHHGKAPAQPRVVPPPKVDRPPPKPAYVQKQTSTAGPSQPNPPQQGPSQPPTPTQMEPPTPTAPVPVHPTVSSGHLSSTPVTRSNCRFHRISIPLDEDAPRVFFVVPGCSLTNAELIEEEEIEDHGVATLADNARLVPNVEALNFSEYLIGVLRCLVGVDLLREHELYYLPQEGDNIGLKPKSPTKPKASASARGSASTRTSRNLMQSPSKQVPKRAGSLSTVSSLARTSLSSVGSASVAGSLSGVEESDAEDKPPRAKRRKAEKRKAPIASSESQSFRARRSKRLSTDAAAYKPEREDSDASSDEDKPKKSRAGKKGQRGLKRARNSDVRQDDHEDGKAKAKKRKVTNEASQETTDG
ncbi:hypothetical protein EIP91_003909 [Steccherinum ochraceum]|uniref:Uncharacterized protein n=1 Tax=Steccherinum ochraceum TaxID=92696 RepID=A0A4R0RAZ2_9APHY|nr:hypothetical protein EIP91_003909 [Steccherinum ochraceum]